MKGYIFLEIDFILNMSIFYVGKIIFLLYINRFIDLCLEYRSLSAYVINLVREKRLLGIWVKI